MKKVFIISLLFTTFLMPGLHGQNEEPSLGNYTRYSSLVGGEYLSNSIFALKFGIVRTQEYTRSNTPNGKFWFTSTITDYGPTYQQLFLRYNFRYTAIGIQPTFGIYVGGIPFRIGLNSEYSLKSNQPEVSILFATGLGNGKWGLPIGVDFNLTRNFEKERVRFYVAFEIPVKQRFREILRN